MKTIQNSAEECEQKAPQTATNSDSIRAAADKLNGAESGDQTTLLFSKELATEINPKRPDITASLIIYGLYLWQRSKVKAFSYVPKVDGQRGAYRSLSDLCDEYPWLTEEAIRKALGRAEKALKGWFVVKRKHPKAERRKLHYWISPKLIGEYRFEEKRKGLLQLRAGDVLRFGMIEAVLTSNLAYVTDTKRNSEPVKDDEERIYRELSPTTLTEKREDLDGDMKSILPCKRNKLSEALAHLLAEKVMVEHPVKRGFYRLKTASENVSKVDSNVAKVASGVSKVADDVSKVASDVSKVARQNEGMPSKAFVNDALQTFPKTPDTNTCSNADSNADSNSGSKCIIRPTAELRSPVGLIPLQMSAGAKKLMQLMNDGLAAYRQKPMGQGKLVYDKGHEHFYGPVFDKAMPKGDWHVHLPYDDIVYGLPGKPYSRKAEIDEAMDEIKSRIWPKMRTATDMKQLRELFEAHPQLKAEHIFDLLDDMNPQSGKWGFGPIGRPKKGHDDCYWMRRISTLGQFLKYLPQLIEEVGGKRLIELSPKNGKPVKSYEELEEPFFSMAFSEQSTTPITYVTDQKGSWRPVFYAEFMKLPTVDVAEHEFSPIREAA